jgi:hypothetical protein
MDVGMKKEFLGIPVVTDEVMPPGSYKLVITRREGVEIVTQEVGWKDGQIYETTRREMPRVFKRSEDKT